MQVHEELYEDKEDLADDIVKPDCQNVQAVSQKRYSSTDQSRRCINHIIRRDAISLSSDVQYSTPLRFSRVSIGPHGDLAHTHLLYHHPNFMYDFEAPDGSISARIAIF